MKAYHATPYSLILTSDDHTSWKYLDERSWRQEDCSDMVADLRPYDYTVYHYLVVVNKHIHGAYPTLQAMAAAYRRACYDRGPDGIVCVNLEDM